MWFRRLVFMPSMAFSPLGPAKAVVNCSCNLLSTHLQPTPHMMFLFISSQIYEMRPCISPKATLWVFKMVPYHFVHPASLAATDGGNAGFAGAKTCPTRPRGQALAIR